MIGLRRMCTPAYVYLVISLFTLFFIALQNMFVPDKYCVGMYSCASNNKISLFALKLLYVVFWTWILNIICKSGYETVSWFLVLIPYVLMFIVIAYLMLDNFEPSKYSPVNTWTLF